MEWVSELCLPPEPQEWLSTARQRSTVAKGHPKSWDPSPGYREGTARSPDLCPMPLKGQGRSCLPANRGLLQAPPAEHRGCTAPCAQGGSPWLLRATTEPPTVGVSSPHPEDGLAVLAAAQCVLRSPGRNLEPVGSGAVVPRQKATQNPGLPLHVAAVPPPSPYLRA